LGVVLKFFTLLILSYLILPTLAFTENLKRASIKIVANIPFNTPVGDSIYITGNFGTCNWKVKCIHMYKVDSHSYEARIPISNNHQSLEFKFTRGSFKKEEVSSGSQIPNNHIISSANINTSYVYTIANWKDLEPYSIQGHLSKFNLYSPQLSKNKKISVLLPENYSKNVKKHYPIIYMHDGQNLFSPHDAVFGNEWSVDETLKLQYKKGNLPEVIIVGIDSGMERSLEYNFYDKGKSYASFIVNTLKPYIDKIYRSKTEREDTFLMGSSYGALISFTIQWEYPHIFKKAAGLSFPAHAKDHYISKFLKEFPQVRQDIHFYMDRGDYAIDASYAPHTRNFKNELIQSGFEEKNLIFEIFTYANHTELDWARRLHIPLNFLLNN
jgi:predicted alpha/beta superfamily hydrolase